MQTLARPGRDPDPDSFARSRRAQRADLMKISFAEQGGSCLSFPSFSFTKWKAVWIEVCPNEKSLEKINSIYD